MIKSFHNFLSMTYSTCLKMRITLTTTPRFLSFSGLFRLKRNKNNHQGCNTFCSIGTRSESMEVNSSDFTEVIKSIESPNKIKEKSTEILVPPGKGVFYNPVQEFNRDLSVLALQVLSKELESDSNGQVNNECKKSFRILEALSATGLRSIRYAKEVPNVTEVISNDISSQAVENIKSNIKHNNVENIVKPSHSEAVALMSNSVQPPNKFEVVDLDPYGSPSQFLDSAVQCVADGGMLLVTCTDMSVLCGHFPETCYTKYGALSLKVQGKHEMAIRIVLHSIQSHASRYKRYIVPILSVSADFYIRIFVKIYTSPVACKAVISKLSMVNHCCGCHATVLQPLGVVKKSDNEKVVQYTLPHLPEIGGKCIHCGASQQMGGPIWNGAIHDRDFVAEMIQLNKTSGLGTSKRILGMLTLVLEELPDIPLYYVIGPLCKVIKVNQIPIKTLRSAILNSGYRVSLSHASKDSIKTDAPMSFIWDLFRSWAKENPVNERNILPGSPGDRILKTPIQSKVDFSERPDANPASREMGLLRYQINPAPYWGPGSRSTTITLGEPKNKKKKRDLRE